MVGLPPGEGNLVLRKMMENKQIQIVKDKVYVADLSEIVKQTEYYKKMQKIEKSRKDAAARN
jgi:hypothetical protein